MPPRLTLIVPLPLQVAHFLESSFISTSLDLRANSPSTNDARSPPEAPAHHWSFVLSGLPSGTGSVEVGVGFRCVRMLGPLGRSSPVSTGRPLMSLSSPPS